MKILFIIFLLLPTIVTGQISDIKTDKQLFEYINIYRIKNGDKPLKWSNELYNISKNHNIKLHQEKSLYHSKTNTIENLLTNSGIFTSDPNYKEFTKFCKEIYSIDVDIKDTSKIINVGLLQVVYQWSKSTGHNINMLTDVKYGSVNIIINKSLIYNKMVLFSEDYFVFLPIISTFNSK